MKTFWFQIIGLVTLICIAAFLVFNQRYLTAILGPLAKPTTITSINENDNDEEVLQKLRIVGPDGTTKAELNLEVADTKEERTKGLGYRESLATDSGLLFIHDNSQKYTYWMKGMRFPIDIMWVDEDVIADITPNVPPPVEGQSDDTLQRYTSKADVNRVLETNAGFVNVNNIQVGDKLIIE